MANMMARMDVKVKVMLACGYGARLTRVYDCLQSAAAASLARHVLSDDSKVGTSYMYTYITILRLRFGSRSSVVQCDECQYKYLRWPNLRLHFTSLAPLYTNLYGFILSAPADL